MATAFCIALVNFYQKYIRVYLPAHCRFYPSCSEYAKKAFSKYGFLKGLLKSSKRLLMCQPFCQTTGYHPLE